MIKKEIYPKTKRLGVDTKIQVTEKLDGSNLVLFKKDGKLFIAQRNSIYEFGEVESSKMYKGLYEWLEEHKDDLLEKLLYDRAICCEWLGMGQIKYQDRFDDKLFMFAKALINDNYELENIRYYLDELKYAFVDEVIPNYIKEVPLVYFGEDTSWLSKERLDEYYETLLSVNKYKHEGFVICYSGNIIKYVRMKNGKLTEHQTNVYSPK